MIKTSLTKSQCRNVLNSCESLQHWKKAPTNCLASYMCDRKIISNPHPGSQKNFSDSDMCVAIRSNSTPRKCSTLLQQKKSYLGWNYLDFPSVLLDRIYDKESPLHKVMDKDVIVPLLVGKYVTVDWQVGLHYHFLLSQFHIYHCLIAPHQRQDTSGLRQKTRRRPTNILNKSTPSNFGNEIGPGLILSDRHLYKCTPSNFGI